MRKTTITSSTYGTLASLPCVSSATADSHGHITVVLHPTMTRGRLVAHTYDTLVELRPGLWQVFGPESMARLVDAP